MTKEQIIEKALEQGIQVKEATYGIFNPEPVFSIEPADAQRFAYREGMYHVSCNRSRSELLSGIRLLAERMKIELVGMPST
jgi:hypothetical protein